MKKKVALKRPIKSKKKIVYLEVPDSDKAAVKDLMKELSKSEGGSNLTSAGTGRANSSTGKAGRTLFTVKSTNGLDWPAWNKIRTKLTTAENIFWGRKEVWGDHCCFRVDATSWAMDRIQLKIGGFSDVWSLGPRSFMARLKGSTRVEAPQALVSIVNSELRSRGLADRCLEC